MQADSLFALHSAVWEASRGSMPLSHARVRPMRPLSADERARALYRAARLQQAPEGLTIEVRRMLAEARAAMESVGREVDR